MNIIIVDDHSLFRKGVETMLTSLDSKIQARGFISAEQAISDNEDPDSVNMVLLDFHIPGTEPHKNVENIRHAFANAKIVIISGEEDPEKIISALDLGVAGFIPKAADPQVLIAALKLILAGGIYLPEQVLLHQNQAQTRNGADEADFDNTPLDNLSARQREVLMQAIDGKVNKIIARELDLSVGTVKAHLSAAYRALGVSNRTEALFVASKYLNRR